MLTVTEISEDYITVFSTFFLIKNCQWILDPNPLMQFSIFCTPTIYKEPKFLILTLILVTLSDKLLIEWMDFIFG